MDQISVFMDGEANRAEAKMTILRLRQSDECQDAWHTFHLIGDALRRDSVLSDGFMTRFSARMESEPLLRAPHLKWRRSVNYALSAAASLAAVAVVLLLKRLRLSKSTTCACLLLLRFTHAPLFTFGSAAMTEYLGVGREKRKVK